MAKRKTRKQKIKLAQKRKLLPVLPLEKKRVEKKLEFGYDPRLIRKDLLKTIGVCGLILGLELLIWLKF